jgi:hypothetical protein
MEEEYSPAELIEERQRRIDEMNGLVALPAGTTARQFMQMVMRGEIEPTPRQMTAAKVLIEYQEPKLSAVATLNVDQNFAVALERAILRSQSSYVPRALPAPEQHPGTEGQLSGAKAQSAVTKVEQRLRRYCRCCDLRHILKSGVLIWIGVAMSPQRQSTAPISVPIPRHPMRLGPTLSPQ